MNNYSNQPNDFRFPPFGNPGPIPNRFAYLYIFKLNYLYLIFALACRWENYPSIGELIEGLPIVACRVPLNEVW